MLYRARLSLLVVVVLLACGGTSKSVQPDIEQTRQSFDIAGYRADQVDPAQGSLDVEIRVLRPNFESSETEPMEEADAELRSALSWALMEYRAAFVGRDLEKLQSIWSMGAVERMLIKNAWSSCENVDLSIETSKMLVAGRSALVDFDQWLRFRCPGEAKTRHSMLSASLEFNGDGKWAISRIGSRGPQPTLRKTAAGPAHLAPDRQNPETEATMHRALEALSDYESALQRCDLDGLARVWIMTDLERQILQGLCFRRGRLEVTISEPQVSTNQGRVSVDFIHDFTSQRQGNSTQTRSRLTALLVERDDGNMTIWKVRATQ